MITHNNTLQELNKVSDNRIIDIGKAQLLLKLLHGYMLMFHSGPTGSVTTLCGLTGLAKSCL